MYMLFEDKSDIKMLNINSWAAILAKLRRFALLSKNRLDIWSVTDIEVIEERRLMQ